MNFVNKSFLTLLTFFCVGAQMMLAETSGKVQFQEDERVYIHDLATEIETMFEFFNDNVDRFIDASDHTPYRKLVMAMSDKLDEFEKQIMISLAKKLIDAKSKNSDIFQQSLCIVHEVLTEFMTKIYVLRNILIKKEYLEARDGVQAIKLGKELEKSCKDLLDGKIIAQLETKVDKVFNLVNAAGESSLIERIKKIKTILKNFKGSSTAKKPGSELKIVNGIASKIRHNKP